MARSISFPEAVALAKSGDAEAQYALSSLLDKRGDAEESMKWLRRSAEQKFPLAQMTMAIFLIDGRRCARDRQQAIDLLLPFAAKDVQANLLLAELHGFEALGGVNREEGLRYLVAAARLGDGGALRQLALLSVCQRQWSLVRPLLDAAARRGDPAAVYAYAACLAEGIGGDPNRPVALGISQTDGVRGQYLVAQLTERLRRQQVVAAGEAPLLLPIDWEMLDRALPLLAADIPLPPARTLFASPQIQIRTGALHPVVLDAVINLAAPLVQRSQIVDARTGETRADPMRNSWHVTLGPRQHDHVLEAVERCIGVASGTSVLNGEFLQILRYRQGEEFRPHVDYFNESGAAAYKSLADGGQRAHTVLIYLNDGYVGGSTAFPMLKIDVRGVRGDLLHFHNLEPDGLGHKGSLHAGTPVSSGEKWLLSKWIRCEPYPQRLAW